MIILADNKNEYSRELRELKYLFSLLQKSYLKFTLKPSIRVWIYCFGKFPKITITIMRLPGIRELLKYYILHR